MFTFILHNIIKPEPLLKRRKRMMEARLQVQVQIGDTRRVFSINPPGTYDELKAKILREIPTAKYMEFVLQ